MRRALQTRLRNANDRLIGGVLILVATGWVGLQWSATAVSLPTTLSMVAFGSVGIAAVHAVFGLYLVGAAWVERRRSFSDAVVVAVLALGVSGGALLYWEFLQSGAVRAEMLVSFPFFASYVAAWAFPLAVATTRRHRLMAAGTICAVPLAALVALPVLFLAGGGWLIPVVLFSIPVVLALIPVMLVLAAPLVVAGWSARPSPMGRAE
ncbi:hypothetical protein JCM17823_10530 [Halorubrum gandharaense]